MDAGNTSRGHAQLELETARALLEAADTLATRRDLSQLLASLADVVLRTTEHDRATVSLWDPARRELTIAASAGERPVPNVVIPFDKLSRDVSAALESGRTLVADYDSRPESERGTAGLYDARYSLLVPMRFRDRLVGLIHVSDPGCRQPFSEVEVALVEGLAAQGAVAIENARLFEAEGAELARTTVLKDVARAAATLDLAALAERVLDTLRGLAGVRSALLYLLDEDAQVLRKLAMVGTADDAAEMFETVELDDRSISAEAVIRDEPVRLAFEQLPELTRSRAILAGQAGAQWLAVPVRAGGGAIGNFVLGLDPEHALGDDDVALFLTVGEQLGVAVENARLHERTAAELARTSLLEDVAEAAGSGVELEGVAVRMLEAVQRHLGLQAGEIRLLDEGRGVVGLLASLGMPETMQERMGEFSLDDEGWLAVRAVREGRVLTHEDHGLSAERQELLRRAGAWYSRYIALPLRSRERILGVMSFAFRGRRPFLPEERSVFGAVARVVAQSVANSRSFELERERARLADSMAEISAELASSLDIEDALPRVFDRACRELRGFAAGVTDRADGHWRIRVLVGVKESGFATGFTFPDEQAPTLMAILRTGRPDITPDVRLAPDADMAIAERAGYRAYVGYPLVVRGQVVGALGVFFREPRHLTELEADYIRRFAFAVSLAEENSRLYKSEHNIAETLQAALLALPDRIPGIDFAHMYHSATEAARVGGDFYDLFEIGPDTVGVTVGDMSGHGVEAAVLTSLVKNAIRVEAMQQEKRPDEVVATASDLLLANSATEIFATVFFGVLHLDDGLFEYCNAGHTTGACMCGGGGLTKLAANAPLAGAWPSETNFTLSREHVDEGGLVFLYTDGLTESRRGPDFYGEDRLFDLLARKHAARPGDIMRTVIDDVLEFSGGRLSDDLAVLVVRRCGGA